MRTRPLVTLLCALTVVLALVACSSNEPRVEPTGTPVVLPATPTSLPDTTPPFATLTQEQLDRAFEGFDEATEVFREELKESSDEVGSAVSEGLPDAPIDALIRTQTVRLVRIADLIRLDADRRHSEFQRQHGGIIDRTYHYDWLAERMTESVVWMRDQQARHVDTATRSDLTTADGALSAVLAVMADMLPDHSSQNVGIVELYMSAARAQSPFSSDVAISGVIAEPVPLTVSIAGVPSFRSLTHEPPFSDRLSWVFNPDTLPPLLETVATGGPGTPSDLLRTYIESLVMRDLSVFGSIDEVPDIYEEVARVLRSTVDLSAEDFDTVTRTGASRLVRNEAEALSRQIMHMSFANIGSAGVESLSTTVATSGVFSENAQGLEAVQADLAALAEYMRFNENTPGETTIDAVLQPVARAMYAAAEQGELRPADRNSLLTDAVAIDLRSESVSFNFNGRLGFSQDSFLLHRR